MIHEIKHRLTGAVLFSLECGSLRLCVEAAAKSGADLSRANLSGADLSRADLSRANLSRADLSRADLSRANLSRADLSRANLSGAYLYGAYLYGAYLSRANLSRADLSRADLSRANLSRADLSRADLSGADLSGAIGITDVLSVGPIGSRRDYLTATVTPEGIRMRAGCFTGSLDEFRAAVQETHGDNQHGRDYRAAIALIESRLGVQS